MLNYKKILTYLSLTALILCLIPLITLGYYNHPLGDDFHFALPVYHAYKSSDSIATALKSAFDQVIYQYKTWQGTYSAIFLMSLSPHIWGDVFYKAHAGLLLLLLVTSIFSFFHTMVCNYLKADKYTWIIISALVSLECIEHVPLMGETFYWYNGAMYYTGFLAYTLFFISFTFLYLQKPSILKMVFMTISSIIIAGGNYVSLLPTMITINLLVLYLFFIKKSNRLAISILFIDILMLGGFTISAICPGNAIRMATAVQTTPIKTVIKAIFQGFRSLYNWTTVYFFLLLILLTPIMLEFIHHSVFSFKYGILASIFIFGIYCSSACPTYYAESSAGHARCFDLFWYFICILGPISYFFLLGGINYLLAKKGSKIHYPAPYAALICIFVVFLSFRGGKSCFATPNSYIVAKSICNGEADHYNNQYNQRLKQLEDSSIKDITFNPYDVPDSLMYVIYLGDLTADPEALSNLEFASFYHKNSVIVKPIY